MNTRIQRIFMAIAMLWMLSSSRLFAQNLVVNGDFEQTSGFDYQTISDYERVWGGGVEEGKFIHDNTSTNHGIGGLGWLANLTGYGGSGYYLLFNGFGGNQNPNKAAWKQTVSVTSQTTYTFSFQVRNLSRYVPLVTVNPAIIRIKINGSSEGLGPDITLNIHSSDWQPVTRTWNSGNVSGPVSIEIIDTFTGDPSSGDDFALDHISFIPNVLYDVNAQDDYVTNTLCLNDYVDVNVLQNDNVLPNTNDAQVQVLTYPVPHGTTQVLSDKRIRYTFTDANYNGEVQFTYRVTNHGVVSEATVHINTARPPTISNINLPSPIDICEGDPLTLLAPTVSPNGSSITSQGWQVLNNGNWQNVNGNTIPSVTTGYTKVRYYATNQCDTEYYEVNLNVHEVEDVTLPAIEVCDSYTWHGTTYTQSGVYDYQTNTQWGCDRTEHLPLTIYYSEEESYSVSACESYTWHGQTYTQSGTYSFNTTTEHGCPRTEWLNLTISTQYREVEPHTECDSYYWPRKQQWYYASALDSVSVSGPPGGCDSTFVLNLTIHYSQTLNPEIVESCDSYYWNGQNYTESGSYTYETTNEFGCTLTHQLQLTIHESESIDLPPITACDSYEWHGQTYTESGTAIFDTVNQYGCNVRYQLPLTINYSDTYDWDPVTACDSYFWYGQNITETGQYTHMSTTPEGCDREEHIYVTLDYNTSDTLPPHTACNSYVWHGVEYTQSGWKTYEEEGLAGCVHQEVIFLTINHSTQNEISVQSCDPYPWFDSTYTESGTYYHLLTNSVGCDSLLILNLTIGGDVNLFEETQTGCESFEWRGRVIEESGFYTDTVFHPEGCDDVYTLTLTIEHNYEVETAEESCYSYTWFDETFFESGDYQKHFTAVTGCDSLVTLHLTIKEAVYNEFEQQTCLPFTWNGVDYYYEGDYEQRFDAANGCDSIVTMHLVESDAITSEFDKVSCTTITWENQICDHNGDYFHTYQSLQGCDSIVTMHFNLTPEIVKQLDTLACEPFSWYGHYFSENGQASHTFLTSDGCDSTVCLNVSFVQANILPNDPVSACNSYTFQGVTYGPGVYEIPHDTVLAQNGCISSVQLLNLTVKDSEQLGTISGASNVYVASSLINGIYRYEIDMSGVTGLVTWSLSNLDWQIVESGIDFCRVLVTTPGTVILTAHFNVEECGEMERSFEIVAGFFGVDDIQNEVHIFPNPTKGSVTIEAEGIESLRLTNMMGQVLEVRECNGSDSVMLSFSGYTPSVYLLEIKTVYGVVKKRLILCR